jgi:hypothetical protein
MPSNRYSLASAISARANPSLVNQSSAGFTPVFNR